jgi:hypothetical protein
MDKRGNDRSQKLLPLLFPLSLPPFLYVAINSSLSYSPSPFVSLFPIHALLSISGYSSDVYCLNLIDDSDESLDVSTLFGFTARTPCHE